jgi:hypothetical protein
MRASRTASLAASAISFAASFSTNLLESKKAAPDRRLVH